MTARPDLLKAALAYRERGWSIVPVVFPPNGGKQPAVKWKRYQTKRPSEAQLRTWFGPGRYPALAVILGQVSGHLACRDFDDAEAYECWAKQHAEAAGLLPTARTHRGYHVYFTGVVDKTAHFDDGELRGEGAICVLPPSGHPEGSVYQWIIQPNGDVPVVDIDKAGLAPITVQQKRADENGRGQRQTDAVRSMPSAIWEGSDEVELAIQATLPTRPGVRNYQVFELVRALKGIEQLVDADPHSLRPIVERWHSLALPHIRTEPFEETWIDFLWAWPRVKFPRRLKLMESAMGRARTNPVSETQYEQQGLKDLVGLCRELQAVNGSQPFFLSCRTAGQLLGVDHTTACRWLFLLGQDGWLTTVEKGGGAQSPRKATRYLFRAKEKPK